MYRRTRAIFVGLALLTSVSAALSTALSAAASHSSLQSLVIGKSTSTNRAMAEIVPALILENLVSDAEMIVIAEVTSVREQGSTTTESKQGAITVPGRAGELRVYRLIRGDSDQRTISVRFLPPGAMRLTDKGISPGDFGVFFLRKDADKTQYIFSDPCYPFIVAAREPPAVEGSDFDRVVAEVANVLVTSSSSIPLQRQAVAILDRVRTASATSALRRGAVSRRCHTAFGGGCIIAATQRCLTS